MHDAISLLLQLQLQRPGIDGFPNGQYWHIVTYKHVFYFLGLICLHDVNLTLCPNGALAEQ